ncbi:MAG: dual specificity protein phosphatase family protein [Deltaproteobacteria bacterium]|nr:dual specificity protein phosphatase family protein [Deltaproteobacteria bacterium]
MKKASKRIRSLIFPITVLFLVVIVLSYFGIKSRWFRAPFPSFGKKISWVIDLPEQAYNFDVVVPGKLYRSGRPDERFISYVYKKYGIVHLISLTGKEKYHHAAKELGMNVMIYEWSTRHLPTNEELAAVIDFLHKNDHIMVHCAGGSDRTGYTVAFYRIWRQNWKLEQAIKEMKKYWHQPERKKALHREIKETFKADGH